MTVEAHSLMPSKCLHERLAYGFRQASRAGEVCVRIDVDPAQPWQGRHPLLGPQTNLGESCRQNQDFFCARWLEIGAGPSDEDADVAGAVVTKWPGGRSGPSMWFLALCYCWPAEAGRRSGTGPDHLTHDYHGA